MKSSQGSGLKHGIVVGNELMKYISKEILFIKNAHNFYLRFFNCFRHGSGIS